MIPLPGASFHGTDPQHSIPSDRKRSPLYMDSASTQKIFSVYSSGSKELKSCIPAVTPG